jgi:biopolymer transport protein ExbD
MKFRNVAKIEPIPLQLAPMIDVLLLLLLFFILTLNLAKQETEIEISVPAADEGQVNNDRPVAEIVVNVMKDGLIKVEGSEFNEEQLLGKLQLIASIHKDQAVILRGDKDTKYENIMDVLNICQKAGIWNVSFATQKPEEAAPPPAP